MLCLRELLARCEEMLQFEQSWGNLRLRFVSVWCMLDYAKFSGHDRHITSRYNRYAAKS